MLSLAILLTVVGAVVALWRPRMRRGVQLAVSVLLTVTACAVVPLVITDLVTGPGVGTLLVLAVAGMEVLAVHLIRAGRSTGRRKEQA